MPAAVAELASRQYRRQQLLARETAKQAQDAWTELDRARIGGSWRALLPSLVTTISTAQTRAASQGAAYAVQSVRAAGVEPEPDGAVVAGSLAGIASDGRPFETLLLAPAIEMYGRIGAGQTEADAWLSGLATLIKIVSTQIADAGRVAAGIGLIADTAVVGYTRQVRLSACARCIILAGKRFRTNQGFLRHPRCDCIHIPVTGSNDAPEQDPLEIFDRLSPAEQDRVFTKGGAKAIRDGGDLNRVVNARRGMSTTSAAGRRLKITIDATTRRARGGANPIRLMPEQIYELALSRNHAIDLLHRHGYLV